MTAPELHRVADALGGTVVSSRVLPDGFSHETCLLTTGDGEVVVRLGGADPVVEAAVMRLASASVPVPEVLLTLPGTPDGARSVTALEFVPGVLLSEVLVGRADLDAAAARALGTEVGRVVAGIGAVRFSDRGFFADASLAVRPERPWSEQLAEFAESCQAATSPARLTPVERRAWVDLCAAHAPELAAVDAHTRLVHADLNPKNILVSGSGSGRRWRVEAVLDWEFAHSGCPYADAGNMSRFAADYPPGFSDGFLEAFAGHQPADMPLVDRWAHLGRVLDMFALSDLVTRPPGHAVADRAAELIRHWITRGLPDDR